MDMKVMGFEAVEYNQQSEDRNHWRVSWTWGWTLGFHQSGEFRGQLSNYQILEESFVSESHFISSVC
jgi:hypothetical protein